ncbi:hypothetical protein [Bradyrhizobium sp. UFLA05-112]
MNWFGTSRARVGYSVGSSLVYLTGGVAYGNVRTTLVDTNNFGLFVFAHTSQLQEHIFRSGLNYHFNTPVVAKY